MIQESPRPAVLVVDDVIENCELMAAYLESVPCDVVIVRDGRGALEALAAKPAAIVLLDVEMPGMNGLEVCRLIKSAPETRMVPVVMVTAYSSVEDRVAALESGADDFLSKPVDSAEVIARVTSLLRLRALYDSLVQTEQVVYALVRAVEAKDPFVHSHSDRVGELARRLAAAAGLDDDAVEAVYFAARLHDIGKIGVPDAILGKQEPLDKHEVALMRRVPELGAEICAPLRSSHGIAGTIRHQRERIDGMGYPDGLAGDAIPLAARILAICDAYDSLVQGERSERPRMADERARAVLVRQAGRAYDGRLLDLFLKKVRPPGAGPAAEA